VLVGRGHRLAVQGAIGPDELHDQPIVVTGHRDGAAHDRAVADLLRSFGVTPIRHRGGPGPALYAAVVTGDAVALTTLPSATGSELIARPLEPARSVQFSLLWRDETPSPALHELIRAAQDRVETPQPAMQPTLVAVA